MDAKTDVFVTALHCCMNTSSAEEIKTHHSTHSQLCQVTGLYIIIWTSRPGPVLTTLERLLHCACIWVNIARTCVLVYIVNLLISAHIQLVHIWILYVCFLSLCSHRPIDIFLI